MTHIMCCLFKQHTIFYKIRRVEGNESLKTYNVQFVRAQNCNYTNECTIFAR